MGGQAPEIEDSLGKSSNEHLSKQDNNWTRFIYLLYWLRILQIGYCLLFVFAIFTQEGGYLGPPLWWKFASDYYIPPFMGGLFVLDICVFSLVILGVMKFRSYTKLISEKSHDTNKIILLSAIKTILFAVAAGSLGLYIVLIESLSIFMILWVKKKT